MCKWWALLFVSVLVLSFFVFASLPMSVGTNGSVEYKGLPICHTAEDVPCYHFCAQERVSGADIGFYLRSSALLDPEQNLAVVLVPLEDEMEVTWLQYIHE